MRPAAAVVETLTALQKETAVTALSDRPWREYLETIKQPQGNFAPGHIVAVERLWANLRDGVGTRLPLPLTQPTDAGSIQLAWDAGRFYVEVDVYPAGQLEWFYRDRTANELDGTEDADPRSTDIPPALMKRLNSILPPI